eukprot:scaffold11.g3910.t1
MADEVKMSIEETNKLRASLGLKPLKMEASEPKGPSKAQQEAEEAKEKQAKEREAAELAERIAQARERRKQQDALAATRKLGEASKDVDDVMAWVSKSRTLEQQRAAEAKKKAAAPQMREQESEGEEDEEGLPGGLNAADLAGAKVRHTAEELEEGETMILTLEDKSILDEKGNLREDDDLVLENILAREDKERKKAFRAAGKGAKPLWEEDGRRRTLLDKYDEEEEEMMQLDDEGALEAAKAKRQADIRAALAGGGAAAGVAQSAEEEMAKFQKPRRKKERRLKKKGITAEELAALEAEAGAGAGADLGSRAAREARAADRAGAAAAAEAERRARFDAALSKANYASLALRAEAAPGSGAGEDDAAAEDEDLYASLAKARQLAQKSTGPANPESVAEQLAARREAQRHAPGGGGEGEEGGLVFTGISEFARTIHLKEEGGGDEAGGAVVAVADMAAEEPAALADEEMGEAGPSGGGRAAPDDAWAGWAPADAPAGELTAAEMQRRIRAKREAEEGGGARGEACGGGGGAAEESVIGEKAIGSGLAGALAFLKERGELNKPVEWAGRTNDYIKGAVAGLEDVYTGGRQEDQLALDVEVALTRKDEYGRILTPKEAWRQLCHRFHGIAPSKNTQEKRARQAVQQLAQKRTATGAGEAETAAQMKVVQQKAATPYVVLSGTIKPGQSRDAASGYATVDKRDELEQEGLGGGAGGRRGGAPPTLARLAGGGGQTPLVGNAKVEAMLGIKRPGSGNSSMAPPPLKAPRRG